MARKQITVSFPSHQKPSAEAEILGNVLHLVKLVQTAVRRFIRDYHWKKECEGYSFRSEEEEYLADLDEQRKEWEQVPF